MQAVTLAWTGAALIALGSSIFGVGVARVLWAQDLKQAERIDLIRSKTEQSLRNLIEIKDRHIQILEAR